MTRINCRAKKSLGCCDGMPIIEVYGDEPMEDDGTYDPTDNTVVCDSCYYAIGMPSISVNEAPEKIKAFQRNIGRDLP